MRHRVCLHLVKDIINNNTHLSLWSTPKARSLRLHTLARFTDWPEIVLYVTLQHLIFYCSLNFIFVADVANMKISIRFIKIDQSIDDWVELNKYRDRICTLAQSHRLAWLLEPTGAKLRASGVLKEPWTREEQRVRHSKNL